MSGFVQFIKGKLQSQRIKVSILLKHRRCFETQFGFFWKKFVLLADKEKLKLESMIWDETNEKQSGLDIWFFKEVKKQLSYLKKNPYAIAVRLDYAKW